MGLRSHVSEHGGIVIQAAGNSWSDRFWFRGVKITRFTWWLRRYIVIPLTVGIFGFPCYLCSIQKLSHHHNQVRWVSLVTGWTKDHDSLWINSFPGFRNTLICSHSCTSVVPKFKKPTFCQISLHSCIHVLSYSQAERINSVLTHMSIFHDFRSYKCQMQAAVSVAGDVSVSDKWL